MDEFRRQMAGLTPAQRAAFEEGLLEFARRPKDRIRARPASGPSPLSFAQRRLWFLDQLEPGSALYNVPLVLRLRGRLDVAALNQTLRAIVARHEALRTTFAAAGGEPAQVVAPSGVAALPVVDLGGIPLVARAAEAERLATEESARPFDLTRGPLLRARLFRLADEEHVLVLVMHHIVSDGWSLGVLYRELGPLYRAFVRGEPGPLQPLPIQYCDYAAWQLDRLQGAVLEGELAYWRGRLAGAPPLLRLPTDRPRPAGQSYRGARETLALPGGLATGLQALGRAEGATLFMTLLGAWAVLLGRYSGQSDLVVGSPIAGRTRSELEGLIGFFVNTLALRLDLSGDPSFRALLGRVREVALGAYAHQELPFERLVEELQPQRTLRHHAVFQVVFALQNTPRVPLELQGLTIERLPVARPLAKFDLSLFMLQDSTTLRGEVEYSSDLFDAATIQRMLGHFGTLLEQIARDPDRRLSALPLLSEAERRRIVVARNRTPTAYLDHATIPSLFEAQAARTPEAVAVVFGQEQVSYAELDRRADRLASRLRGLGVGPEVRVGLLLERSTELVVGLLGILKAGGAYLPLDPGNPPERSRLILADGGARVLVTESRLAAGLGTWEADVVCVDQPNDVTVGDAPRSMGPGVESAHLAYVLYTSGSTGVPKGVAVSHRNVVRLVRGADYARFGADEVFLQLAPVAFDASTFEIWGALLNGARLVVAPPGVLTPEELGMMLRRQGVTTLWLTAGLFHLMVDQRLEDLRGVRQLFAGGDVLSVSHAQRVVRELPQCRLSNAYGPTETTTFATVHPVQKNDAGQATVPIGRPLADTWVYVLDHLQPVPIGLPGELFIAGAGVARGYLGRPGLTAERFLPDPFGEPGERLYRTGDRVRWRADGLLEFLGRLDQQAKIRGFRAEPGEVEAVLAGHPAVRATGVVVREDRPGEKRLVAYVVPNPGQPVGSADLRAFLSHRLPDYLVPSAFVPLDELPLTPNGKLDRRALPSPDDIAADPEVIFVAPRTPTEAVLAGIWTELLRRERVGVRDNFFALGGHSLLATQVISRVRRAFQIELPLRVLFETPTVAELAERVEAAQHSPHRTQPPPLVPLPRAPYQRGISPQ